MIRGQSPASLVNPETVERLIAPPDWLLTCRLMLLLHKTEKEIYDGMSQAMINRLAWVLQQDADREALQQAEQEAKMKVTQQMNNRGGVPPTASSPSPAMIRR